jgi:uncharacterized protein YndB with AHSA1/START domain
MATASKGTAEVTLPSDTQILITRDFDAPRHLVYEAYTTPELIKRWWAGKRGGVTVAEVDLRVGGRYRYAMETAEGFEVAFNGEFREIVPNERIVNTEAFEGAPEGTAPALVTITFEEAGEGTRMEMRMDLEDEATRDAIIESGMEGGLQEGLDILEEIAIERS